MTDEVGPYEYKTQYVLFGMASDRNGNTGYQSYPEAACANIPRYEVDGWEFHSMFNDANALYRRKRVA